MYPISVQKNNYNKKRKKNSVSTPLWLSQFIFALLPEFHNNKFILDVGCGNGNLSYYFNIMGIDCKIYGIDIREEKTLLKSHNFYYLQKDFFNIKKKQWQIAFPSLILCNPPFNDETGKYKKKLLPELFFKKIIELFGSDISIILFAPMGFRLNQKKSSSRYKYIRDCGASLTSIISLPIDTFDNVLFHSEILIFNIFGLKPHYFINYKFFKKDKKKW